jgi:Arc/MetJ family transcription regulator
MPLEALNSIETGVESMGLAPDGNGIILRCRKMRITVEIDAKTLKQIQQATGRQKKSPAVARALDEFLRQHARREFIERAIAGKTDFGMTNDELEARDVYEAR